MDETVIMLLKLTEENARYKAALNYLKDEQDNDIKRGYSGHSDVRTALAISGIRTEECNVIKFENCDDVAMDSEE